MYPLPPLPKKEKKQKTNKKKHLKFQRQTFQIKIVVKRCRRKYNKAKYVGKTVD